MNEILKRYSILPIEVLNLDFQVAGKPTINTFVGGKLLGPTFLGSSTVKTVGFGVKGLLLAIEWPVMIVSPSFSIPVEKE